MSLIESNYTKAKNFIFYVNLKSGIGMTFIWNLFGHTSMQTDKDAHVENEIDWNYFSLYKINFILITETGNAYFHWYMYM